MIDVQAILKLHEQTVAYWHGHPIANHYQGFLHLVCEQHSKNFLLWHEEDIARSRDVSDAQIAAVKRAIDGYNQQRNDCIERLDEALLQMLGEQGIVPQPGAPLNTETPGSAIDRLSIMSLRIYHMQEQLQRDDASPEHQQKVEDKLAVLNVQIADLSQSLEELVGDIFAGRKLLRVYRQFKMYNDPTLNPYLYRRKAG